MHSQKTLPLQLAILLLYLLCLQSPAEEVAEEIVLEKQADSSQIQPNSLLPIGTTRPSFTDAWLTIPQGSFQAENGTTYTDSSNHTRSWVLPESLLKLGIGQNTELRFAMPNYIGLRNTDTKGRINNLGDTMIGLSQHLSLPKHNLHIALIPMLNLPTGANTVSANALDPQGRIIIAKSISAKLTLASQFDARWHTGKKRHTDVLFNPTLVGYYAFTPKLTGFLEYASLIPTTGKNQQLIQTGALYTPTSRQKWDIRIATGLNRESPDILVGFGYSFRIDNLFKGFNRSKP